jgi:hypothetical protein
MKGHVFAGQSELQMQSMCHEQLEYFHEASAARCGNQGRGTAERMPL